MINEQEMTDKCRVTKEKLTYEDSRLKAKVADKQEKSTGEMGKPEEPTTISLSMVVSMFQDLKEQMKTNQEGSDRNNKLLRKVVKNNDADHQEIVQLKQQVCDLKLQNNILVGVMKHYNQQMSGLEAKVEQLEINSTKNSIIITGFYASNKKEIMLKQLYSFFNNEMEVQVEIVDAYPIGGISPRPTVVTLANQMDKIKNFQARRNIMHLINQYEKPIYINEYLPNKQSKQKR